MTEQRNGSADKHETVAQHTTGSSLDWRDHAACRGMDTDLFFYNVGASPHIRKALQVCHGNDERPPCPVRHECGEFALSFSKDDDIAGVFGGMTPAERKRIRKERSAQNRIVNPDIEKEKAGEDSYTHRLSLLLNLIHETVVASDPRLA